MPSLNLNGKVFTIEELKDISIDEKSTDFEKSTLKFCASWLCGQKAFTINTSGSTGTPKEIILSREAMEASARQTIKALQLKDGSTSLVCLDTKYIAGQMMLVRSLLLSMNIIATEPSSNPLENISQQIEFIALVPYQLENILDHAPEKLDQVRCAIIGGAALSNSLKEKIKKSKCAIYATYGMTETISHIALQKLNGVDAQNYFEALENIHLRLDERGCLCIKADYLGEEITTNDLVELIDDKKIKWLGRIDNVINSGGVKIIPERVEAELEKVLNFHQINSRLFVAGIADEKLGQRVVAILEGPPVPKSTIDEIIRMSISYLSKYEIPKEFRFVDKFAETKNRKVNRIKTIKDLLKGYR